MFSALTVVGLYAEVRMQASLPEDPIIDKPERPIYPQRPIRPVVPVPIYGVNYNTYVTTTESNCAEYIEIIKEKDEKIEALLKENARLKEEAQTDLQERLKGDYDKQLEKFEERGK